VEKIGGIHRREDCVYIHPITVTGKEFENYVNKKNVKKSERFIYANRKL
jgi:hypothetical protein